MANTSKDQYIISGFYKKSLTYFISGTFLLLAALLLWVQIANAGHISYDAYADSVADSTSVVIGANNTVGGPDGTNASLAGVDASLTLDMGAGEEGTDTLRIYFSRLNSQVNLTLDFMDGSRNIINTQSRQLDASISPVAHNFAFNWISFDEAYRYVRLSTSPGSSVDIDAVEALGYVGSTDSQDTDSDGLTDRFEQHNGTDPLVATPRPAGGNDTTDDNNGGSASRNDVVSGKASDQVNLASSGSDDGDGNGMTNDLEAARASIWPWLVFIGLLICALLAWLAALAAEPMDPPTEQSSRWYRLRYRFNQKFKR